MFFARVTSCLLLAAGALLSACGSDASVSAASTGAVGGAGGSVGCSGAVADRYEPGLKKPGSAGLLEFALLSSDPAPPALDDNTFVVQVTDLEGAKVSGELSVALEMPEHGHPSPKLPDIRYDPQTQAFTLEPLRLFMVGLWRVTFSFAPGAPGSDGDSAVFELCID